MELGSNMTSLFTQDFTIGLIIFDQSRTFPALANNFAKPFLEKYD